MKNKIKLKPIQTTKELTAWSRQKIVINCTMREAGDLMDILFMADASPFNDIFTDTLKINHMTGPYNKWLNRMVHIVTDKEIEEMKREIKKENDRKGKNKQKKR